MNLTTENFTPSKSNVISRKFGSPQKLFNKEKFSSNAQHYLSLQEELTFWNWMNLKFKNEMLIQNEKSIKKENERLQSKLEKITKNHNIEKENLKSLMKSEVIIEEKENYFAQNLYSNEYQLVSLKKELEKLNRIKSQLTQEVEMIKLQNPQFKEIYSQSHQVLLRAFNEREDQELQIRNEISTYSLKAFANQNTEENEFEQEIDEIRKENAKLEEEIEEWRRELWLMEKSIWKKKEGFYTEEEVEKLIEKAREETEGYKKYLNEKLKELKSKVEVRRSKANTLTPTKESAIKSKLSKFLELTSGKDKKSTENEKAYIKEFQNFVGNKEF